MKIIRPKTYDIVDPNTKRFHEDLFKLFNRNISYGHGVNTEDQYKGKGVFIAGGAGVTPFISIFRDLKKQNKIGNNILIFSNKTEADIILKDEFVELPVSFRLGLSLRSKDWLS